MSEIVKWDTVKLGAGQRQSYIQLYRLSSDVDFDVGKFGALSGLVLGGCSLPVLLSTSPWFSRSLRGLQAKDHRFINSWAELCWDVVLLGKALSSDVHFLDPGVTG